MIQPSGTGWYILRTGKYINWGQEIIADAPYTDILLFVKEGSIIPCGPDIQYVAEKPADPIRLFVYTGSDGSFSLYEDENINFNYEKGKFSTIPFSYNEKKHILTIGKQQGKFTGMLKIRTFEIKWVSKDKPSGFDSLSNPYAIVKYDGALQSVKMQ